jgi:nucleoside-diphosphate-sugar epimerase
MKASSAVLVTGAAGFIGREVVRRLLAAGRVVAALGRPRGALALRERLARAVGPVPDATRLLAIEADLTRPACGLGRRERRFLHDSVETVIHCAGDTDFFPEDPGRFRAGHVHGPRTLMRLLASGRLRRWAHLSTAYVSGRRSGTVLESEDDVGQDFHNFYEQVKLESEIVLRDSGQRLGLDVRVFRPSIVVGPAPATAGGGPANLLFAFIRLVAAVAALAGDRRFRLRIAGAPRAPFNVVPVDYVARVVAALAECPAAGGATFHLVLPEPPTQAEVLAMITGRLGVSGPVVVDARGGEPPAASPLERRVARLLAGYRDYLEQDVRFDDSAARRAADRCGIGLPSLSPEAVHALVDLALTGTASHGRTRPGPARVQAREDVIPPWP